MIGKPFEVRRGRFPEGLQSECAALDHMRILFEVWPDSLAQLSHSWPHGAASFGGLLRAPKALRGPRRAQEAVEQSFQRLAGASPQERAAREPRHGLAEADGHYG